MTYFYPGKGLIVSCQALLGEPLYGYTMMAMMAKAAVMGGAVGIRANGARDIHPIKRTVDVPVIGLNKRRVQGSDIYITPELSDVIAVVEAGADAAWQHDTTLCGHDRTSMSPVPTHRRLNSDYQENVIEFVDY